MTLMDGPKPANIIARVMGIILHPKTEWEVIDGEAATVPGLYVGYAAILAVIPAVAQLVGGLRATCVLGLCVQNNPIFVVVGVVINYLLSLAALYGAALVIDALAPSFGGQSNRLQALKLAIYSSTAYWLASIFGALIIIPFVGLLLVLLTFAGLYSIYLFWVGLPILMKPPADKAVVYTLVSLLVVAVLMGIAIGIGSWITGMGHAASGLVLHVG